MRRIFMSAPDISGRERDLVGEAFDSNYVAPAGPMLARFEADVCAYTGFSHAVALTTATAALHLTMRLCEVGPGDEVWTASATFIGGAGPIHYAGGTPVFFDSEAASWTMDPALVVEALDEANRQNRLPRLVMSTDLYGQACDIDPMIDACARYGVPFVSDSAEAVGAFYKGRHAGRGAKIAVLSFNGNKIITTSGGGMLLSDDAGIVDRARYLATQARQPFLHYEHTEIGYNYRMSNISAAIGIGQLEQIEQKVDRRRAIFARYAETLGRAPGVTMMPEPAERRSTNWLSCLTIDPAVAGTTSAAVIEACEANEIEVRPLWKPMHMQPVFEGTRFVGPGVCERLFETGICLPSGSGMSDAEQDRVIDVVGGCLSGAKG